MRSSRRALPSPWKKFSRRWPDYSYYSCVGEKVARRFTSDILSLSLSSVPFQIGERITMELIITDVLSVLSVNRGIVSRENRGNFVIRQTRI